MPGPESETLAVWISALTDTGKVRRHNEDYIGYLVPENHGARASQGALMVVCDGVGGGSAGEVASERAVHRILRRLLHPVDQPRDRRSPVGCEFSRPTLSSTPKTNTIPKPGR